MNWNRDFSDDVIGKSIIKEVNEQMQTIQSSVPQDRMILETMSEDERHSMMLDSATKVLHACSKAITRLLDPESMDHSPEMKMHRILHASSLWSSRMQGIGPMLELIALLGMIEGILGPKDGEAKKLIIPQ